MTGTFVATLLLNNFWKQRGEEVAGLLLLIWSPHTSSLVILSIVKLGFFSPLPFYADVCPLDIKVQPFKASKSHDLPNT